MEAGVGGGGTDFSREAELNWITDDDIDTLVESYVFFPYTRVV